MPKLDHILRTEMTRKKFLATVGAGAVSLFGISAVMGLFTEDAPKKSSTGAPGYGDRNYGP